MTLLTVLASYPKSGNTWLRAFLESLRKGGAAIDINDNMAGICPAADRAMFDKYTDTNSADLGLGALLAERPAVWRRVTIAVTSPPVIKTHDALFPPLPEAEPLLPPDVIARAIYIVRDPRDVAISFAHHFGLTVDEAIDCLADEQLFLDLAQEPETAQLPQFVSSWSRHVASWLDEPGIERHVVRYEDMHTDPLKTFAAAARFLDMDDDAAVVRKAVAESGFGALQGQEELKGFQERDPTTIQFFRRGKTGGWREDLTHDQATRVSRDHGATMERLGYQ